MSTKTLPVTAGSFEKVFAAVATKRQHTRRQGSILTDWREIAWAALERKKLGDTLRRAIEALSVPCREVLFLQDVKNLNTAETAWVLNITVGAARYHLLKARMRVRDALASSLLPKLSQKNADLANSYTHDICCKSGSMNCPNPLSLAKTKTKVRLTWLEPRLAFGDRDDLVAVNHQNRPRRTADRQVCVRKVNELSSQALRWFSLALDRLPTHEINRNQINHS
jgi:hypothetical protein